MTEQTPIRTKRQESPDLGLDLRAYSRVLLKRKWVLISCLALCVVGTVLWTLRQPKQYVATASIIIDPKTPEVLGNEVQEIVQIGAGQLWWNEAYYRTQVQILSSRKLALRTVAENKLGENPDVVGQAAMETKSAEQRREAATNLLMRSLTIKQEEMNHIFKVKVKHVRPETAAFLANAYVEAYKRYTLDLRTEGTEEASRWLAERLDSAQSELHESEIALLNFRRDNDILTGSLEDTKSNVSTKIDRYTSELNDATIKVIELGQLRKHATSAMKKPVLESPIFALTDNETGPLLKGQYYEELKVLHDLEESFLEKEPRVIKQKRKVKELLVALDREASLAHRIVVNEHKAALGILSEYQKKLEEWRGIAHSLGKIYNDYERYHRKEQKDKDQYKLFSDRLSSSELTGKLTTVNIRVLDEARVPLTHAFPHMGKNVALAVAVALMLGMGLVFFFEFLDRSIKNVEDVETAVKSSVLGVIPLSTVDPSLLVSSNRDLLVHHDPKSRTAECCRQIRTNLLFTSAGKTFETFVVTSPSPKEGKSTTVMYLATTMAQSGQRVLVVDSDMRRPRLHKSFGVTREMGLSNLMVGSATIDELVKPTEVPNLSILPCGPTPPNPAELLMTNRFSEVLEQLKERYDRVIFDSPPMLAVTDALIISQSVDGVLLVLRSGKTTKEQAASCAKQLRDVNAKLRGVVLNRLDLEDKSYGYYNQYQYYYSSQDSDESATA